MFVIDLQVKVFILRQISLVMWAAVAITFPFFASADSGKELDVLFSKRLAVKVAARDPFFRHQQIPVADVKPPEPVLAAPVIPVDPAPQLNFIGRMNTPDGRAVVLAQWGDGQPVTLEEGQVLTGGYRVERMSAGIIELLNPQTQTVLQLPLPPSPRFETR